MSHQEVDLFDVGVRRLLYGLAGYGGDRKVGDDVSDVEVAREAVDRVNQLEAENEELRETLDEALDRLDQLEENSNTGKNGKVADIVAFAANKRTDEAVVPVTPSDIKGATGVSRRYAYDLVDDLVEKFAWAHRFDELPQYGDLERENSKKRKALAVDFEGVHGAAVPVNLFTTRTGGKGGSD